MDSRDRSYTGPSVHCPGSLAVAVGEHRHNASMSERRSYKDDLPGSRQAPCLGCGRRVVTARDPHVEIGGKRDGSVLVMYEAKPLLAFATNPDQVFEPGLELLGVAHRACMQLARKRLEARQVDLPDDLPRLIVDQGVQELPALHLPPPAGRCAFCRATEVTDEHVWPKWISGQLRGHRGFTMATPHGPRKMRSLDITAPVCVTCNNRWLSVLEKDVQPVLGPLIYGEERTLSPDEQRRLATWVVKTALMLDLGGGLGIASGAPRWNLDQRAAERLCQHLHGLPSRLPGAWAFQPRQHECRRPTLAGRCARTYLAAT
jgi:hypothetical protein